MYAHKNPLLCVMNENHASTRASRPSSVQFSGPTVAREIARSFGTTPQPLRVNMKGHRDVASLLSRVAEAKSKAHLHPIVLD